MESEAGGAVAAITSVESEIDVARSAIVRVLYGLFGFVFLGIGAAGFVLPGMPGTIFLLVAVYLFSMSNERMYRWMLTNGLFGQELQDFKSGLGIARRVKIVAVTSIILSVGLSTALALSNPWARAGLIAFGLVGIVYILNQPTREVEVARRESAGRSG
jgi:uncharacterized membrane protein YbaN (DUF454 family)